MGPGDVMVALVVVGLPVLALLLIVQRTFRHNERKLELRAEIARAAEASNQRDGVRSDLEQRVRVLEQIVTDRGAETAAQIEALRSQPRIPPVSHTETAA